MHANGDVFQVRRSVKRKEEETKTIQRYFFRSSSLANLQKTQETVYKCCRLLIPSKMTKENLGTSLQTLNSPLLGPNRRCKRVNLKSALSSPHLLWHLLQGMPHLLLNCLKMMEVTRRSNLSFARGKIYSGRTKKLGSELVEIRHLIPTQMLLSEVALPQLRQPWTRLTLMASLLWIRCPLSSLEPSARWDN